ncbi:MAG: DNA polymerase I [Lachnospiraceae bacterium]|uniref:DNA polymerase I n=1 Tax=Hominisplanchenecus murintestinalis TaxID=2941517 RepID=A0AC61R420_9FIRM|nr:DNA polymerase I [Hominisplanchenecus murintestinalis]MCI9516082.1 DNA polymerase I [Lachnospiraceae bacterium]MCI9660373.1 DNA polymerase I [Lachnospiraceae bacterium]TGY00495.1 DNA polymerase I [Hominisplanchenecus murintestinalis]
MGEKIVLIDGHSILNRAFYGVPDLTNSEGLHTNAVYGFLNIMFKILEEEKPDYLAVAFDLKAPTFRHKMYAEYKGTRKPMPQELHQQVPVIQDMLRAMEIPLLMLEGYEADDLLGTVSKRMEQEGLEVCVVSGDRDLLQLATEHIMIRIPKTKRTGTEIENYHTADVLEKYQVTPLQIIDLKALMGDASDNIPGIPGVGEKTATKIIAAYGSIENAYAHVEEIKPNKAKESLREHYALAQLSKELATINIEAPLEFELEEASMGVLYTEEAFELCKRLEFKNMLSRFECQGPVNRVSENFRKVSDLAEAEKIFETAAKAAHVGFELILAGKRVRGCALCFSEEDIYFIPAEGFISGAYLCGKIDMLLNETAAASTLDLKAQLPFFANHAREKLYDLALAAYLLNPLKDKYTYEDVAKEHMSMMIPSQEELLGRKGFEGAEDEKAVSDCACYIGYVAWAALEPMQKKLLDTGMDTLFREIEMPLVYTLHDMEREGIRVEAAALKQYGEQLIGRIGELETEIYAMAGETFNINSPKQLGVILFEKLKLPYGKKTKTGYSTAADVLEKLADEAPVVSRILEYRQLTKLKSTYADGLANYIAEDGRIHSTFKQTITATGRISSTEPNLQNIPIRMELGRLIRKVFIPKDGYVFVDADYSQIELRVLAAISGDETLIHAYREAQDIHRITASQVFHIPFDEVTDLQRRNAKAVNFGIVYGISSFGLSQDLSITRKEAAQYIEKYFETYPGIKKFLDDTVENAKKEGYVTTLFGRRRPMPELKAGNFMQRSFGERVAMNAPIQGTAADIIKIAMIRVNDRLKAENLKSRLILQVHDELLIEAEESETDEVKRILLEEMQGAAELSVKLEIDMHTGKSWYEAK